jgi:putative ABC transport system permease protein
MTRRLIWLSQIRSVTALSLQTITERKGASTAAAFGIAGVVAVLVGVLSIAEGFVHTMTASADPSTAIVMRSGSDTEMMSLLVGDEPRLIGDTEGVAQSVHGFLASPELFVIINLPKRSSHTEAHVPLRGVEQIAFRVHAELEFVGGRPFESGRNEVIVGVGAAHQCTGLDLGSKLQVGRNEWTVVGVFRAKGGIAESEIWTDARVLQGVYQRGNSYQSVYVKLTSPAAFETFQENLARNPRLNVKVLRQSEYYAEQSRLVSNLINTVGILIASVMALGAVFGALNTMYTAVSARTREIATLRALGFRGILVALSVLIESLGLATAGGTLGAVVAYFAFDGFRTATLNFQSMSQVAFAFAVTPELLVQGIVWALLIGLIGGLSPALRAARLPIARALHEI